MAEAKSIATNHTHPARGKRVNVELFQIERSLMPHSLRASFLTVEMWQWIGLAFVALLAILFGFAGRGVVKRGIRLRSRLPGNQPTDATKTQLIKAAGLSVGVVAAYFLVAPLGLHSAADRAVAVILNLAAIYAALSLATSLWDAICDDIGGRNQMLSQRAERLLLPMTRKFVRFVLVTAASLAALSLFVANLTGVIAGLGIGGLVVALAAKDSVENVFGSLTIMFDMPFALGDWVKIDKVEGVVEEINLRSTRVRTFEDTVINLPNANLIRASVENYGARRSRRQKLSLRLHYENQPETINQFAQAIRNYLSSAENVVADKTIVELEDFSESSIGLLVQANFEATTQSEELALRNALMTAILNQAEEIGIRFSNMPVAIAAVQPPPQIFAAPDKIKPDIAVATKKS